MTETWLIDLGSSRVKWQVRSGSGAVREQGQWEGSAGALDRALPKTQPGAVWLARVGAAGREQALLDAIRARHGDVATHSVRPEPEGPAGLCLDYDCSQFGADRYCALLGVLGRTRAPAVVIDAGTAVTIDLLGADGRHLGGYILPGFRRGLSAVSDLLSAELQVRVGAALGRAPSPREPSHPGHDTAEALMQGWMHGLAGAVERLGSEQAGGVASDGEWWLTGGDGPWLAELLDHSARVEPDLVFDGLWLCARDDGLSRERRG
ncbi:type III pantothenate kinase [Thioalkalivibrio sp.]|uniref:type III pantothenate kinase n=1 Tax=Thioalkalivibrio sp. TaxID=2093813 RepID=UPI0012D5378E|nr:type III pantothenate kinase [Thioalkalivibrio sp.]TVP78121.1 MAG: type III pantothenate kinase [Thioalkalivibrio sp.]